MRTFAQMQAASTTSAYRASLVASCERGMKGAQPIDHLFAGFLPSTNWKETGP